MRKGFSVFAGLSVLGCAAARADVKLPEILSDRMVLQRGMAAPVWGTADPKEEVSVSFAGQTKTAVADGKGQWRVNLDPLAASAEPRELTVKGKNTVTLKDVLVGEVWIGSGQSNMDLPVAFVAKGTPIGNRFSQFTDAALVEAASVEHPTLRYGLPPRGPFHAEWRLSTPKNNPDFSALLFAFGVNLQRELGGVPVGLICAAVSGSSTAPWMTEEMCRADAGCREEAREFAKTYDLAKERQKYEAALAKWKAAAEAAKQKKEKVWPAPPEPLPAGESGALCSEKRQGLYWQRVLPVIPFAIRGVLWDQGESGTAITGVRQCNAFHALIVGWRKAWGQEFPFLYVQKPSGLGTAWDLNDPVTKGAEEFVALPKDIPYAPGGVEREQYTQVQRITPKTAMVTASDLVKGVHPENKVGYAARAVQVAMGFVYGKPVETSGPLYASHKIESDKVRVTFTHVGKGLAARHGDKLQGFMVAGEDRKFQWADAAIDGDAVVVSSPQVAKPVAVRYAWAAHIPWANLFNKDGLPAPTFRTDDWK